MSISCERKGMTEKEVDGSRECEKKLGVGSLVEVRLTEKGLRGSWHPAVVVKAKPGRRVVEYDELLSDVNEGQKLQETISVGKGVDGVRASCRKVNKTPSKDRTLLRPRPPKLSQPRRSSWTKGLWVDVFWKDSWWEGILLENITPGKETVSVFCPDEGGVEAYAIKDLRIRQEWNEETGLWSLKGKTLLSISSFKDSKRLKFSKQEPDSAVKKLKFSKKEQKCTPENHSSVKAVEEARSDDDLLSSILERSKRKQCPSRGAVKTSVHSPPTLRRSDLLKRLESNRGGVTGDFWSGVHKQSFAKKQVSITRKAMQEAGPGSEPLLLDWTGRKGKYSTVDSRSVGGFSQVQECRARKDTEGNVDTLDSPVSVGGRRRQLATQNATDIKGINARMSPLCRPQQEAENNGNARCVHVKEEQADECVDMVVDEKGPPRIPTDRVANGGQIPQRVVTTEKAKIATALRNQHLENAGESDSLEAIENHIDGNHQIGKSERDCRKRSSGSHLGGEADRRSKKSRGFLTDESGALVPGLSQDEGARSRRGLAQHKSFPAPEKSGKKKGTRGGCRMEVLLSAPGGDDISEEGREGSMNVRKNILSWLIDAGALVKDQKLCYLHKGKKDLGHGWVTADGVLCGCCNDVFTLSYFEAHCGSKLHRPCQNIFVDGGKSLTDLQMEVFKKGNALVGSDAVHSPKYPGKRRRSQKEKGKEEDGSDDTCGVCGDGGMLVCCDHCPSTFHLACMELQEVPKDDWYCPNCRCAICGGSQFNGDQSIFNELTVLFCDQCEREFHVKCLYERGFPKMEQCPQESWFCGQSCTKIYQGLRGLVGATNSLKDGFSWTLLRSQAEDLDPKSEGDKELMAEHNIKLSMALSVMQECFRPMIDPRTKVDLVAHALYSRGSDVSRLNYRGFYTMILEKGDELVSVATIRVHGAVLAEMPLIGTRYQYRRQGMCRRLMSAIEQMLQMVGVESLVLPAVPELMETWTEAFGFQPLDRFQKRALIELNLMAFPGTSLLRKPLPTWHGGALQFVGGKELGLSPIKGGGLFGSPGGRLQTSQAHSALAEMVNVPIGGPRVLTDQDVTESPMGEALQSYLVMKDAAKRRCMFGSDSPASSAPPREVVSRRELVQNQHGGPHADRYRENGSTPKQPEENMYSTRVVVGTTRSKRLVKTTRWVADAVNKLTGRSSGAQADPSGPGRVPENRQLTLREGPQATFPRNGNGRTLFSPSPASCSTENLNPAEPRKLIIRIKLSKLKEKKEKRRKKKEKRHKIKRNAAVLEPEASLLQLTTSTEQRLICLDASPGQSSQLPVCNALSLYQASSSPMLQTPTSNPSPLQIIDAVDCEVVTVVPKEDFGDLGHTLRGCGSKGGMRRLEAPGADLVEIVPALDGGRHLLPMLKHRTHLLQSLSLCDRRHLLQLDGCNKPRDVA